MKKVLYILTILLLSLSGCASSNNKAVAMNLYTQNDEEPVLGTTAIITKEMIEEVKKRKQRLGIKP